MLVAGAERYMLAATLDYSSNKSTQSADSAKANIWSQIRILISGLIQIPMSCWIARKNVLDSLSCRRESFQQVK